MEEIPNNHLGCTKPCNYWDKLPINWLVGFLPSTVLQATSQTPTNPNERRKPWRNRLRRRNRPRPCCPRPWDAWRWPCGAWNERSGKRHWRSYPPRRVVGFRRRFAFTLASINFGGFHHVSSIDSQRPILVEVEEFRVFFGEGYWWVFPREMVLCHTCGCFYDTFNTVADLSP